MAIARSRLFAAKNMAQQVVLPAPKTGSGVTAIGFMLSPLTTAHTVFAIAAVACVLAFAEEFFIAHVRLSGMVGLHMPGRSCRSLECQSTSSPRPDIFACGPKLPNIVHSDKNKARRSGAKHG